MSSAFAHADQNQGTGRVGKIALHIAKIGGTSEAILPTLRRANAGAAAQALMTPHSQGINHCRRFAGGIRFSAISARLRQG